MACFAATVVEAVVATAAAKTVKEKETETTAKIPFSRKLKWLSNMLWGGSALLAFEHLWHGEIVPWAPFLTAASNPADLAGALGEIATVGVAMAAVVTAVWGGIVAVTSAAEKKAMQPAEQEG